MQNISVKHKNDNFLSYLSNAKDFIDFWFELEGVP